ncbi:unnamed protein product, partial [Linum tenue]
FPRYLSLVKGVVDSDDFPLNVSREILQESRIVRIMRKRLVRKTFDMIRELSESENKECSLHFRITRNFGRIFEDLIEPIDEVAIQNLKTYKENKFDDISKEDLELGNEDEVKEREAKQEYNALCDGIKQQLGDKFAKVQVSKRLSSSPCVLVFWKFRWFANMERLMKAQALGDTSSMEFVRGRRILEINPYHPIVKDLNAACIKAPDNTNAKRAFDLLYDTTWISSGFTPGSPADLGIKIYEMMAMALRGSWDRSSRI